MPGLSRGFPAFDVGSPCSTLATWTVPAHSSNSRWTSKAAAVGPCDLTSASLMIRWGSSAEAAAYARDHPRLSLGLDLDLDEWVYRDETWMPVYQLFRPMTRGPCARVGPPATQLPPSRRRATESP